MTRWKRRIVTAMSIVAVLLVVGAWQGLTYALRHGYSIGMRSGVVRKVSIKGSVACKYVEGELALQGTPPGGTPEIWQFSADHEADNDPVLVQLQAAERNGARVTLHYRQDRHLWWRCNPSEYFVTSVEK
jgi:hypothetical protein